MVSAVSGLAQGERDWQQLDVDGLNDLVMSALCRSAVTSQAHILLAFQRLIVVFCHRRET